MAVLLTELPIDLSVHLDLKLIDTKQRRASLAVYQCDAGNRNYLRFSQYFPRYGGATGQVGLVVNGFSFAFFFFRAVPAHVLHCWIP